MALNGSIGLGFVLRARDLASPVFGRVAMGLRALGSTGIAAGVAMGSVMGVAAAGAIALGGGLAILGGSWAAAQASAEFEQGLARVGALTRATTSEMNDLRDAAVQAGIATQFSPAEAAEGLAELGVRGFSTAQSISALTGVLDLAAGGGISVAQSAATVGAALRAFRRDASQASITTDQLLRISNATALQANDLAIAIGNVSRGANVANQGLEEMVSSIGLVRNTGVEASVAASSVSSALIFMARNRSRFDRLGVSITDANGRFRDFLDVVRETDVTLRERFTNEAERAAEATRLFGRFGLTAFTAIGTQLREGIRTAAGQIVRGAEAVKYLRSQLENAEGAAAEFRERLLSTFRGQLVLLSGTIQTLGAVFGGPFARVFRPFVKILTDSLNLIIRILRVVPDQFKTAIAAAVVFSGAASTVIGAVTLLSLALAALAPFLSTAAGAFVVTAALITPLVVGMTRLIGITGVLSEAARRNVGGFGKFVDGTLRRISLAWEAVTQLFRQGGFTGAVRDQLRNVANRDIQRFAIVVFAIGTRVVNFFRGLGAGIKIAFQVAGPAFEEMIKALRQLGESLGILGERGGRELTASPIASWFSAGVDLGRSFAYSIIAVAEAVRDAAEFIDGLVTSFDPFVRHVTPAVQELRVVWGEFVAQIRKGMGPLLQMLGFGDEASLSWGDFGRVMAVVVARGLVWVIRQFTMLLRLVMMARDFVMLLHHSFEALSRLGTLVGQILVSTFEVVAAAILNALDTVIVGLGQAASAIPAQFRPGFVQQVVVAGGAAEERVAERTQRATTAREAVVRRAAHFGAARTEAEERARALGSEDVTGIIGRTAAATAEGVGRAVGAAPINVNVQVDGETIARASSEAGRAQAEGEFRPVGTAAPPVGA